MNSFLSTIVFSAILLLIVGCRENSITEPVPVGEFQKADDASVTTGTILLESMLRDPHPVMNSYYLINGEIQYQHVSHFIDPIQPNSQSLVSLNLTVSANFTNLCTVCTPDSDDILVGTISIATNDNIDLPEECNYILVKTFKILGRDDGMVLKCSFVVTKEGVSLNSMHLAFQNFFSKKSEDFSVL